MSVVLSVVSAVFWGLLVLSLLVFVHEGGHYLAARACGVRVTEFFLGLPCPVKLSHKSREYGTEIGVTPVLLGGYTRICGMEGEQDELLAPALACVQRHGRVEVSALAAELGCDADRAYALVATLTDWAAIRPYYDESRGERRGQKDWPAAFETLRRDASLRTEYDRGHDFAGEGVTDYGQPRAIPGSADRFLQRERSHTYLGCGFWKRFAMLVAGPLVNIVVALVLVMTMLTAVGITVATGSNVVGGITPGSFAEAAGLQVGDRITKVGEVQTPDWQTLSDALDAPLAEGRDFTLTYERDGQATTVTIDVKDGAQAQYLGIYEETQAMRMGLGQAFMQSIAYARMVGEFAARLVMPQHTMEVLNTSSSIVGISVMASEAASTSAADLISVVAAISMSLGFMNLLPIPPLDGGKVLIEVVQVVIRRQLSMKAQAAVSYVGLAFFMFVFVVVLRNDIMRFVIG